MVKLTRTQIDPATDPIGDFIDGSYLPLSVHTPGARSNDNYVPAGWSSQPELYGKLVKPYCSSCHWSLEGSLGFLAAPDLLSRGAGMQRMLCDSGTRKMPHSEVAFNAFWTTDPIYWPARLQDPALLGLTNCAR